MAKFEDLIEQVRELDEGLAEELEGFTGTNLRKQLREAEAKAAKVDELTTEIESLKAAPKRREAFEKYGIDFENLRKAERALLEKYEGELTDEAIAEFVEENELPVVEGDDSGEEGDKSDAEKIAAAAKTAGSKSSSRVPKVTPEDVAEWSAEKWAKFADANPDAAEALRRGEEVTGVTG